MVSNEVVTVDVLFQQCLGLLRRVIAQQGEGVAACLRDLIRQPENMPLNLVDTTHAPP